MVDLSSALITTFTGMVGVVIGATINNYLTQKINRHTTKKDIIFRKKMEYFEKLVESIEKNLELYKKSIKKLERINSKKEAELVLSLMKKDRKRFEPANSSLYLDTREISENIKRLVAIEKLIFLGVANLSTSNSDLSNSEVLKDLKQKTEDIQKLGQSIILNLRKDLLKE